MLRLAVACALALLAGPLQAQAGLRLHAAVTADAPGDTTGFRRAPLATAAGGTVYVGEAVLDVPLGAIQTVGLEDDPDGTSAVTVWLDATAAARLADVTGAAAGRALAVLHAGRVLGAPRVESAVPNGLVLIAGLDPGEAARVAAALRGDAPSARPAVTVAPTPVSAPSVAGTPPSAPPASVPSPWGRPASSAPTGDAGVAAETAALAFVRAVAGRQWGEAADLLDPDAHAALRADALGLLRLDGAEVYVRDGLREGSVLAADVLGRAPALPLDRLGARDLTALYLAGLDAIGVWGAPDASRAVVGRVEDGDRAHVVLRAEAVPGMSDLSVVTVRRDGSGRWRVLLTEARGF